MKETVTFTHHQAKPEYKWEVVVPEGPTVLLPEDKLPEAMDLLGVEAGSGVRKEIEELPNGGSRSINADIEENELKQLVALSVKTV